LTPLCVGLGQAGSTHGTLHFAEDIIARRQVVHLMCEASGPKPSQTIFLGGNGLFHTDNRALTKSELGIERTAQFRDA
jgi:hypothetical protein